MKKQILLAFLGGMALPLVVVLAAGAWKPPESLPQVTDETASAEPVPTAQRTLSVLRSGGETEQMPLDQYLMGVLLAEMPADFEPEALKAQAVVARTYTARRIETGRHGGAAVCTDPDCCQGFRETGEYLAAGGRAEAVEKIRRAVEETAGEVLTYEGELIDATYFSCSGGFTEDAVAVWGRDVPYLQAVESPGEEQAPRYRDELRLGGAELCRLLGVEGSGPVSGWFGKESRTEGGGVDTIEICGVSFTGAQLRTLLGLRSTAFEIGTEGETVCFHTRGFGHRVGMSQYGAQAMAQAGKTYREILSHYYQGTTLEKR